MTDLDALLAAVIANRDEDAPRLLYADELQARGLPGDEERAEFIRVQCELSRWEAPNPIEHDAGECETIRKRGERLFAREQGLLKHLDDWYPPPCKSFGRYDWVRGFIDHMVTHPAGWMTHAEAVLTHPLRKVTFTTPPELDRTNWDRNLGSAYFWLKSRPERRVEFYEVEWVRAMDRREDPQTEIRRRLLELNWPWIEFTGMTNPKLNVEPRRMLR